MNVRMALYNGSLWAWCEYLGCSGILLEEYHDLALLSETDKMQMAEAVDITLKKLTKGFRGNRAGSE